LRLKAGPTVSKVKAKHARADLNQSFDQMPTSGKDVSPIDISAFAKIRFSVTVNGSGSIPT
jgi:hypothetical protein